MQHNCAATCFCNDVTPETSLSRQYQTLVIEKKAGGPIYNGDVVLLKSHTGRCISVHGTSVTAADCGEAQQLEIKTEEFSNLARDRPATSSSTGSRPDYDYNGGPAIAVDGKFDNSNWENCQSTQPNQGETWWSVRLEQNHTIGSLRITGVAFKTDGVRINPFRIKVGDSYCKQKDTGAIDWNLPQPFTGDFTCAESLFGDTVTVELPGKNRILQLCEVEVYAPWGETPFETSKCYGGHVYPHMEACKTCNGPGPTHCTSCHPQPASQSPHQLIPWRNVGPVTEGSCVIATPTTQMQKVENGNQTVLTKWALEKGTGVIVPGTNAVGLKVVSIDVICAMRKSMICTKLAKGNTKCEVKKDVSLYKIDNMRLDNAQQAVDFATRTFMNGIGSAWMNEWRIINMPLDHVQKFANISSIHELCADVIQLS